MYEGKSCRNLYRRSTEHVNLMNKRNEKSVLYKHEEEDHKNDNEEPDYKFEVVGTFTKPLPHIINEGARISQRNYKELMNTKEYSSDRQ